MFCRTLEYNAINELQIIQSKIYELREQKVMLDFDLAQMYEVKTAQLKRAVRPNIARFEGEDFMFELTKDEISRCQIGILNGGRGSNFKYMPFAFTELGVAMLSSVLRSETAIEVNRGIMRAFVAVRQMIAANPVALRLSTLERGYDKQSERAVSVYLVFHNPSHYYIFKPSLWWDFVCQTDALFPSLNYFESKLSGYQLMCGLIRDISTTL